MPILNIIISFFLIFQFSLGNFDILSNISNISKANEIYSVEADECGEGCRLIKFWKFRKCICPPKPKYKYTLNN